LRATLNRIFDLKQENRRREIDQLQRQIAELQNSLKQRERMREEMIDRRLQQLVDAARSQ
jgi:alcohol dehydrogenase class IV